MSSDESDKTGGDAGQRAASGPEKRRRAERLLGEILPDTTSDENDEGWSEASGDTRDDELRRDVPPHHG
ncbi:MAG: hypothetical protein ACR2FE_10000 [Aeromicrobium sp.]